MSASGHALLSPSSASRWLVCTPSVRFEESIGAPDTAGEAAKEGSVAHELCECILRMFLAARETDTFNAFAARAAEIQKSEYYNNNMSDHVNAYVAHVIKVYEEARQRTSDAEMMVEARLDLTDYIRDGFGTGDALVIGDGILDIIDLKYGKGVPVSCVNNKQMMIYALGALKHIEALYEAHTVRMTIFQPRLDNISSYEMSVSELREWAETELRPKAQMAYEGAGEYVPGEHCRFCKAKVLCRANAEHQLSLAKHEFADPNILNDADIADILSRSDSFKSWVSSVEEYALQQAVEHGKRYEGFKLVEGRSVRSYTDQDAVAKRLTDNGIEECLIYERRLLGITAMEKQITKKRFNELLSDLVIKPQGKPSLVPLTDKRPEWSSADSAQTDFSDK